jgi:tellurite resistance protein TerC
MLASQLVSAGSSNSGKADITIEGWHWPVLVGVLGVLLLIDILVIHRKAHEVHTREAVIESAVWISIGLLFGLVILWEFGGAAGGEYYG